MSKMAATFAPMCGTLGESEWSGPVVLSLTLNRRETANRPAVHAEIYCKTRSTRMRVQGPLSMGPFTRSFPQSSDFPKNGAPL
jgi:hypothetical protein